ncbi:hypothetical protein EB796_014224 [Bugula neritina]|uniref:Uncharacterized protein n=1 Tax=Bugula neritina TaxID=10212 RepID=A0A7J7JM63_BUGNE|nr:hypothetical protein EB796_014224 [Bugula neritina]
MHYPLHYTLSSSLYTILFTIHYPLHYTLSSTLYTIFYTIHYLLHYTLSSTLYTILFTLHYPLHSTLSSTLYTILFTILFVLQRGVQEISCQRSGVRRSDSADKENVFHTVEREKQEYIGSGRGRTSQT